jgi:hypothetical protein
MRLWIEMAIPLEDVSFRIPCDAPWESMTKVEAGRYCDHCALTVHDLSAMTESAVRALLATRHETRVCIRYHPRRDGTIRTAHEPVIPASRLLTKAKPMLLAVGTMLAAACGPGASQASTHDGTVHRTQQTPVTSCGEGGFSTEPDCDPMVAPVPPGGIGLAPEPPPVHPEAEDAKPSDALVPPPSFD